MFGKYFLNMIVISSYNLVNLFLLLLLIQLIDSAPQAIDELSINLNIRGTFKVHYLKLI